MELTIETDQNLTLSDLLQKQQEGFSVMRSAHVGNARIYNQVLANAGIKMLLVDHNITGKDANYVPGSIVTQYGAEQFAPNGVLSMRTEVSCPITGTDRYIDEIHQASLATAFSDAEVLTNTVYVQSNESIVSEVIDIFSVEMPELFTRYVETDQQRTGEGTGRFKVTASNMLQLQDNPRKDGGILIPNDVDIISNFVVEALATGQDMQYHISGPDMINYTAEERNRQRLQRMYELLGKTSFGAQLPPELTVVMPRGTDLWLAAPLSFRSHIDALLSSAEACDAFNDAARGARAEFFASENSKDPDQKQAFLNVQNEKRQSLEQVLQQAVYEMPNILVDERTAPYISQYDTLQAGGLYVPRLTAELSFSELALLRKKIRKMQGNPP